MVTVNYMKKILIFVILIVVLLVAYLALSKKDLNTEGNQANVISNIFGKNKAQTDTKVEILKTSTGRPPITPVIRRFSGNDPKKIQEVFIDGMKKQVPKTPVPR